LRLRTKDGTSHLRGLSLQLTFIELKKLIEQKSNIPPSFQRLRSGYPPEEIFKSDDTPITGIFSDGDLVTVEKSEIEMKSFVQKEQVNYVVQVNTTIIEGDYVIPFLSLSEGVLLKRKIEDDHSCLFNAVGYCLENKSIEKSQNLRNTIANIIAGDQLTYNEGILQKTNGEYCNWIKRTNSWGGSIELMIFSDLYKSEIYTYDVTRKRPNIFGEGKNYKQRIYLLYNGIHYDCVVYNLIPDNPSPDFDITVFNPQDQEIEVAFQQLAENEYNEGNFVDEYNYSIICNICKKTFKGNKEVEAHAKETKHTDFSQN